MENLLKVTHLRWMIFLSCGTYQPLTTWQPVSKMVRLQELNQTQVNIIFNPKKDQTTPTQATKTWETTLSCMMPTTFMLFKLISKMNTILKSITSWRSMMMSLQPLIICSIQRHFTGLKLLTLATSWSNKNSLPCLFPWIFISATKKSHSLLKKWISPKRLKTSKRQRLNLKKDFIQSLKKLSLLKAHQWSNQSSKIWFTIKMMLSDGPRIRELLVCTL